MPLRAELGPCWDRWSLPWGQWGEGGLSTCLLEARAQLYMSLFTPLAVLCLFLTRRVLPTVPGCVDQQKRVCSVMQSVGSIHICHTTWSVSSWGYLASVMLTVSLRHLHTSPQPIRLPVRS